MDSPETSIRLEANGAGQTIYIAGALDLSGSALIRQALVDVIVNASEDRKPAGTLDLSELTRVDLVGLQLLCSAHRTTVNRGGDLELGAAPDWFHEISQSAGFVRRRSTCPHRRGQNCLWRA